MTNGSVKIAVDVGYGLTKAASSLGLKACFPSVAAPATPSDPLGGALGNRAGHRVSLRGAEGPPLERLVGEAALRSLAAAATLSREKPAALHDLFVVAAAYLVGADSGRPPAGSPPELCVGLPLAYYSSQRDALRKRLSGLAVYASVDGGPERRVSFSRVLVVPQGAGVAFAEAGRLPDGLVGVVDVGTYTTDYLLLEVEGGRPMPVAEACGSAEVGVHLVARAVASAFQAATGAPLPVWAERGALEKAARGEPVKFGGRAVDLTPAYRAAVRDAATAVAQQVLAAWGNRAAFLEATLLAGGGAVLFRSELERALPCARVVDDPLFANCRGYLAALGGA
ncbi:MAG: hypothetical protein ACPLSY_04995 [Moorellaceae bacterium]